jgi:hypothetical protein
MAQVQEVGAHEFGFRVASDQDFETRYDEALQAQSLVLPTSIKDAVRAYVNAQVPAKPYSVRAFVTVCLNCNTTSTSIDVQPSP